MKFTVSIALLTLLLAGCAAPVRPPAEGVTRAVTSAAGAVDAVGRRYTVVTGESELRVLVFADGPLARFGHPHVVGGGVISGNLWLAEDFHRSSLELFIDVPAMRVDDPGWRLAEGFDSHMDADAIAGTGDNMRAPAVLDAGRHPRIVIRSVAMRGPQWQPDVTVEITLRGQVRALTVPVALEIADGRIAATGRFRLRQTEFGIEPFAALGGRLRVADEVLVRFRVVATER